MKRFLFVLPVVVCCFSHDHVSAQQNPNGVLPLSTVDQPFLFLIRDPVVHRELKLTPQQQKSIDALNDRLDAGMWSRRNKPLEVAEKTVARITRETQQQLRDLLQPEQLVRLGQIEYWVLGLKSLGRQDIAAKLELDATQVTEIRRVLKAAQQEVQSLQKQLQDGGDAAALNERFREVQKEQQTKIVAILEEPQKQRWIAMLGARPDLSKLGRIKFKAPELASGSGWVNSVPLTLDKLKGKVVALHFYAFA